jgi:hypothetical protein
MTEPNPHAVRSRLALTSSLADLARVSPWVGEVGVDDTEGGSALRPDEEQDVLPRRHGVDLVDEVVGAFHRMPVDFEDDVARSKAGIVSRAGGAHALDCGAVHLGGNVQLRAKVGREVRDGEAEFAVLLIGGVVGGFFSLFVELADSDLECLGFSVAKNAEADGVAGGQLADGDLERAAIDDLFCHRDRAGHRRS